MKLMKVKKVIRQAPKEEDVHKLLSAWQGSQQRQRDRLLIALLVDTGARITEVCSIELEDVNLEEQTVKVMGKGGKERVIPISTPTVIQLREYIPRESPQGKYLFPADNKLGYQGIRSLEKTFRRLCKRLGIKLISPHGLRYYCATTMLKNGARIEIVSRLLGHSSVAITDQVYVHIGEAEVKTEHEKFGPLHRGS